MLITLGWARTRARPFVIGPHDEFELAVLVPGQVVRRWSEVGATGRVLVPMQCHPRQNVTVPEPRERYRAQCRLCGRAYQLELIDENDGGWAALLTCVEVEIPALPSLASLPSRLVEPG